MERVLLVRSVELSPKINIKAMAMQEILPFVQASSPLTLAPSTTESLNQASNDGSFPESFFSIILGQFTQENNPSSLLESTQEPYTIMPAGTQNTAESSTPTQEAKSIDEHLLEDLLTVVSALQQDPQTTVFPTLNPSSTLEKLLASETTRQEFANVKSVSDLMDLSQKYNLGLEKLSISTESAQSLQSKFPTLAQNNFFDDLQSALSAQNTLAQETTLPTTTSNVMSLLDKQPVKTETSPVNSILSELISKEVTPEVKTEPKTLTQTAQTTIQNDSIEVPTEEPLIVNEKQQNTPLKTTQTIQEEVTKVSSQPLESVIQKVVTTTKEIKETKKTQAPAVAELSPIQTEEETPTRIATTRINEVAAQDDTLQEERTNIALKTLKTDDISDEAAEDEVMQLQKVTSNEDKEMSTSTQEETQPSLEVKNDVKTNLKQDITSKTATVKESLSQFATDLKEKVEAYRPPIMKVELSLSPKNLGDVDVTLLTRGNNLHVNISSNSSTMSLFTQNQSDVKNALINMGFTNLEMNFSDQRNQEQAQQNQKHSSGNFDEFTAQSSEEETTLLEIVIPQYV